MEFKGKALAAVALSLPLLAGACDAGTDSDFGEITLQLTDAPADAVVEAWVTFTEIYLQSESGDEDPAGGRVFLMDDGNESHELTRLANAVTALVEGVEVPTGTYGQLRVVMSGACIETSSGAVYASAESYDLCGARTGELRMPSMQQSGAKVLLNGLQVTGGQHILLLDFDVSESFGHAAGQSGAWVMTPVIHTSEVELTGGIDVTLNAGDVTLPDTFALRHFSATLLPTTGDSARVGFTDANVDGTFEVGFLFVDPDHGPFQVRLNAPTGVVATVDPTSPTAVSLTSGGTATVDWTLQSAELEGGTP